MQPHKAQQLASEAIQAGYDITATRVPTTDDWHVTATIAGGLSDTHRFSAYGQWAEYRATGIYRTARRNYEYCATCHAEDSSDCTCSEGDS